jgi:CubicO group peptidase (beta-lactamase class C family)
VTPFPEPGAWHDARPAACGLHPDRLADAVRLARTAETRWPVDLGAGLSADPQMNEPAPWNEVLGPTRPRGGPSGMIVRRGQVAARWGDPARVDMTFSVAKSYLALLAGVAVARGLIASVDDPVCASVPHPLLDSPHNARVTWRHLLQQTSEWEGTLWDKPDLVDRNRQVGPGADNSRKGTHRDLGAPGSFWEYNDVRVNLLSLMLLHVFRRPLPEVLAETIMEPIGATGGWEWLAYRNARVEIDGHTMPSVPGGAHWGGGLVISAEDHARVGLLVARDGLWAGRTVLEPAWVREMLEPCPLNPAYGYLWWLNTERAWLPAAPASSVFAMGAGRTIVWVDAPLDLVVVARWIDAARTGDIAALVIEALAD